MFFLALTLDDSVWSHTTLYYTDSLKHCMTLYDLVWLWMTVLELVSFTLILFFNLFNSIWFSLTLFDSVLLCLTLSCSVWFYLIIFDQDWLCFDFLIYLILIVPFYSTMFQFAWICLCLLHAVLHKFCACLQSSHDNIGSFSTEFFSFFYF